MTALAPAGNGAPSLVTKLAGRFGVDPNKLLSTLKATAFRQRNNTEISNEQMMALLVVADQYGLNPFTKEIFAFEDRGAIVPVVSVDGWARIINTHHELDGIEFRYSEEIETMPGGKPCPAWCEAAIYRKDRARPIVVREYLDEVYQPRRGNPPKDGPWQTHTKRFLRHKTLIQCSRVAFGFAGIYDQDEGERIIDAHAVRVETQPRGDVADLSARLRERAQLEHGGGVIDVAVEPAPQAEPIPSTSAPAPTSSPTPEASDEAPGADSATAAGYLCSDCWKHSEADDHCTHCGAVR